MWWSLAAVGTIRLVAMCLWAPPQIQVQTIHKCLLGSYGCGCFFVSASLTRLESKQMQQDGIHGQRDVFSASIVDQPNISKANTFQL